MSPFTTNETFRDGTFNGGTCGNTVKHFLLFISIDWNKIDEGANEFEDHVELITSVPSTCEPLFPEEQLQVEFLRR